MDTIEIEIEEKVKSRWTLSSQTDDKLKTIAKDLYNGLIFCDRQCRDHEISQRFMILMFMGPKSNSSSDTAEKREGVIYDILERDLDEKYYKEYLSQIGLIYEYLSEASPMGLNGGPIFMSGRFLNKPDTDKMFEFYNKYKELREETDNF